MTPLETLKATLEHQSRVALRDFEQAHKGFKFKLKAGLIEELMPVFEREIVDMVLRKTHGQQVQAAQTLGINRNTLRKQMTRYNLNPEVYKESR